MASATPGPSASPDESLRWASSFRRAAGGAASGAFGCGRAPPPLSTPGGRPPGARTSSMAGP
eukprot:14831177-Alexandrium_andersonii.AAC.1